MHVPQGDASAGENIDEDTSDSADDDDEKNGMSTAYSRKMNPPTKPREKMKTRKVDRTEIRVI